jgi:hypothetical protein
MRGGQWTDGDLPVLVVVDAGHGVTRLTFLLCDLPVELLGRPRSNRVMYFPPRGGVASPRPSDLASAGTYPSAERSAGPRTPPPGPPRQSSRSRRPPATGWWWPVLKVTARAASVAPWVDHPRG